MAPKHGSDNLERQSSKRAKNSEILPPRSTTRPAKVPFQVEYPLVSEADDTSILNEKNQQLAQAAELQVSPFIAKGAERERELDQHFVVTPIKEWTAMKQYDHFIIQGDVYKNNQLVYVCGENTPESKDKYVEAWAKDFWIARILQVRAKDQRHVYALVAWLYWSEDLPPPAARSPDQVHKGGGKRKYHGTYELIPSNYMDVLDVLSFAGKAEVDHWLEEDDTSPSRLYWRQTFNRTTQQLSKLRQHCTCHGYFNPDVPMYICDNAMCKIWLHEECILDETLRRTYESLVARSSDTARPQSNSRKKMPGSHYKKIFKAKLIEEDNVPMVRITDSRASANPKQWTEQLSCPKCNQMLR